MTDDPYVINGSWSSYAISIYIFVLIFTTTQIHENIQLIDDDHLKKHKIRFNIIPYLYITIRYIPFYIFANISDEHNTDTCISSLMLYYVLICGYFILYSINIWSRNRHTERGYIQCILILCCLTMSLIISRLINYQNQNWPKVFALIVINEVLYIIYIWTNRLIDITGIVHEIDNGYLSIDIIMCPCVCTGLIKLIILLATMIIVYNYDNPDYTILLRSLNNLMYLTYIFTFMISIYTLGIYSQWNHLYSIKINKDIKTKLTAIDNETSPTVIYTEPRDKYDSLCTICMDHPSCSKIIMPCGHICSCDMCLNKLRKNGKNTCPYCRTKIKTIYKISGSTRCARRNLIRKCYKCKTTTELFTILMPCRHLCCKKCSSDIKQCPKCKKSVVSIQQIYIIDPDV